MGRIKVILVIIGPLCSLGYAQDSVKPIGPLRDAKTSAKLSEAIERYVQGDFVRALKLFDDASLADLNDPIPWVDGALANLRLGHSAQAFRAFQQSNFMGERSGRASSIASEIQIARGQYVSARSKIKDAEFLVPEDPYTHTSWASFYTQTAQLRAAERSRWQAYRSGRTVLMDSVLSTSSGASMSVGANAEADLRGRYNYYGPRVGFQSGLSVLTGTSGGNADAVQKLGKADFATDVDLGTFVGSFRLLDSERPGTAFPTLGIASAPGSKLYYDYFLGGWQKRFGDVTVHLDYRSANANLRPTANVLSTRDNLESQWIGEGRYDHGPWTAGIGASTVYRSSVATPAIEPLEQVFDQGRTNLGHTYLVHRFSPSRNTRLISGVVVTSVGGVEHVLATAELAVKMFGNRYLRLGSKPTMDRVGTNLWPEDLLGEPVSSNPIDSTFGSALEFNRTPMLPGAGGSGSEQYLSMPLADQRTLTSTFQLFRRTFQDSYSLGANPVVANNLYLSPLSRGSVVGLRQQTSLAISHGAALHLEAAYQTSHADYSLPTRDLGTLAMRNESRIPNVPNLSASAGLDWTVGSVSTALSANYVGSRIQAITTAGQGLYPIPTATFVADAPSAWGIDFHLDVPLGGGTLHFAALNLANARFYLGSGTSRALQISFSSRF